MNLKLISPSDKWSCPFYIKTLSHFCWEQLPQAVKYVPCELAFKLSHLWQCAFMESINNFKCLQGKFKPIPFHPPLFLHSPINYSFPFSFSWYITYLQNCLKKKLGMKSTFKKCTSLYSYDTPIPLILQSNVPLQIWQHYLICSHLVSTMTNYIWKFSFS